MTSSYLTIYQTYAHTYLLFILQLLSWVVHYWSLIYSLSALASNWAPRQWKSRPVSPSRFLGTFQLPIRNIKAGGDIDVRVLPRLSQMPGGTDSWVLRRGACEVVVSALQAELALSRVGLFALKFQLGSVRYACPSSSSLRHTLKVIGSLITFPASSIPFGSSAWTVSGELPDLDTASLNH